MPNMILENTRRTQLELPAIKPVHDENGKVKHAGFPLQKLLPGQNTVNREYYERCLKIKCVAMWKACKYIVDRGDGEAVETLRSLASLAPENAKKQIHKCTSIELLSQWSEGTENRVLRKLIEERKQELIAEAARDGDDVDLGASSAGGDAPVGDDGLQEDPDTPGFVPDFPVDGNE